MQQNFLVVELVNISTVWSEESVKVNVKIIIYPRLVPPVCSNERVKADNKS